MLTTKYAKLSSQAAMMLCRSGNICNKESPCIVHVCYFCRKYLAIDSDIKKYSYTDADDRYVQSSQCLKCYNSHYCRSCRSYFSDTVLTGELCVNCFSFTNTPISSSSLRFAAELCSFNYCKSYRCGPGRFRGRYYDSSRCTEHSCVVCAKYKITSGSIYKDNTATLCQRHKHYSNGADCQYARPNITGAKCLMRVKLDGCQYCNRHSCNYFQCGERPKPGFGFCEAHLCAVPMCRKMVHRGSKFCRQAEH